MGKILTYYVHPDRSVEVKRFKFKENKVIVDKNMEVIFKPEHIFLRKRRFLPPQPCLILMEGKPEPEKINVPLQSNPGLFPMLTYGELSEYIQRLIARSRMRIKPISLNLFIILVILHIITIVLLFMLMKGVRIG